MTSAIIPFRATKPVVLVKTIGGQFSATFLRRRDGSVHRLQVFADPSTAARSARLLNAALAEARP